MKKGVNSKWSNLYRLGVPLQVNKIEENIIFFQIIIARKGQMFNINISEINFKIFQHFIINPYSHSVMVKK